MGHDSKDDAGVPASDDLAGWKKADYRLAGRFADHLNNGERLRSPRAILRYFDEEDILRLFEENEQRGVVAAYASWGMLDYRPTKTSPTRAEQLLAEGLPPAQAMLLQARIDAHPTIYRVTGHDPQKGAVDLEDVLLGGCVTVFDRLMSRNIENGLFLPARAFPAGQFHFLEMIGPPLGAGQGMDAMDFLHDCGLVFTREGLLRGAHKFGWLWRWCEEWQASWRRPQIRNMDGHELLFHTASFSVQDPASVRTTLLHRPDIDHDEDADEFIWWRAADGNTPGERVCLGRLAFVGDELVLSVNSAERFARAREWMSQLPGVAFLSHSTTDARPGNKERPLDDQLGSAEPVKLTPELFLALQAQFKRYYMKWLDSPLPMLGGMSPREASRTPDGREQVARMIRSIPDPVGGPVPMSVPREEMLRALGIATGPSRGGASTIFDDPPASDQPSRIGRNERCPCGSGRKFKHCCGGG